MKTYDQLTSEEKERAMNKAVTAVLEAMANNFYNGTTLGDVAERAGEDMERNQTPWFFGERVMELAGDLVREEAQREAEMCFYAEHYDLPVVLGVCL